MSKQDGSTEFAPNGSVRPNGTLKTKRLSMKPEVEGGNTPNAEGKQNPLNLESHLNVDMKKVKEFADNSNSLYDADILLISLRHSLGDRKDMYILDSGYRRDPSKYINEAINALSEKKISFFVMPVHIPEEHHIGECKVPPCRDKEWIKTHIPGCKKYKAILAQNQRMQSNSDMKNCGPYVAYFFEQWLKNGCDFKKFRKEWKNNKAKFEIENYRKSSLERIRDVLNKRLSKCQSRAKPPKIKDSQKVPNEVIQEGLSESSPLVDQIANRQDEGNELKEMNLPSVLKEDAERMRTYGKEIGELYPPNDPSHKIRDKIITHLSCDDMSKYLKQTEDVIKDSNQVNKISKLKLAEQYLGYILMYVKLSGKSTFNLKGFYDEIKMTDKDLKLFHRYKIIQSRNGSGQTRSSPPTGIDQEKMQLLLNSRLYKGPSTNQLIRACSSFGVAIHLYGLDAQDKLQIQIFDIEGERRAIWRIAFCNNIWIPLQASFDSTTRLEDPKPINVKDVCRSTLWKQVITEGIPTIIEGIRDLPENISAKIPSESQEHRRFHNQIQQHVETVMPEFLQYNSEEDGMLWINFDEYFLCVSFFLPIRIE
ncbi:hypothetical protein PROFUN_15637 [Planoprotostelium fungivorum]|uniref:Uncharacterized protein n=2 Tax=Planoprotostelium fungivorum TaxID=1890364 RepID=A0A2P6MTK0_9EUKA|nr:hypothetical protein PROFUN_15637 [Planoprotostelium fungivorum]